MSFKVKCMPDSEKDLLGDDLEENKDIIILLFETNQKTNGQCMYRSDLLQIYKASDMTIWQGNQENMFDDIINDLENKSSDSFLEWYEENKNNLKLRITPEEYSQVEEIISTGTVLDNDFIISLLESIPVIKILKLPNMAIFVFNTEMVFEQLNNHIFLLKYVGDFPIGSQIGVSRTHGAIEMLYKIENYNSNNVELNILNDDLSVDEEKIDQELLKQYQIAISRKTILPRRPVDFDYEQQDDGDYKEIDLESKNGFWINNDREKINLYELPYLQGRQDIQKLKILCLSDCRDIPIIPSLVMLDCSSSSFEIIPGLPNLKKLLCMDSDILTEIKSMPKLMMLDCNGCQQLQSLNNFPVMNSLSIQSTSISSLDHKMPYLENLDISDTKINQIPIFPVLKQLVCQNTDITTIPELPTLVLLDCSNCRFLTDIPILSQLELLNVAYCENLQPIPFMENIQIIRYNNASRIAVINYSDDKLENVEGKEEVILINGYEENINSLNNIDRNTIRTLEMKCYDNCTLPQRLDNLEELEIPNCNVDDIPIYPNLKMLNCENTKITRIGSYPKLENINALNCDELKVIEVSPELKFLTCENSKIEMIGSYPKLEHLNVINCEELEIIEVSPKLKILNCTNTKITTIGSFPDLVELYCSDCPNLVTIESCPNLKELYCTNCPSLIILPIFPVLEILHCPSNIEVPAMPNIIELEQQ